MSPSYQKANTKRDVNGTACSHLHIIDSVNSFVVNPGSPTLSNSSSNPYSTN